MKTILQPADLQRFTDVEFNAAAFSFRNLDVIEGAALAEFSPTLRADMVAQLADYTGTPTWTPSNSYNPGDAVVWRGVVYRALVASTNQEPPRAGVWEIAPRFTNPEIEDLFCRFIGPFLAFTVLLHKLPFLAARVTGAGVVKTAAEGYLPAGPEDLEGIKTSITGQIDLIRKGLKQFVATYTGTNTVIISLKQEQCQGGVGPDRSPSRVRYKFA